MTSGVDKHLYNLLYDSLFGGGVAIDGDTFVEINGFSNLFYGKKIRKTFCLYETFESFSKGGAARTTTWATIGFSDPA